MGSFIDISGNKYGRLTVLKLDYIHPRMGAYWICRCECGKEKSIFGASLKNGKTASCGCYNSEKSSDRSRKSYNDISNQKFGRLTTIQRLYDSNDEPRWECFCDCGKKVFVRYNMLVSGRTKSCGCYMRDRIRESNFEDLSNQRFGKLLAIEESIRDDNSKKEQRVRWTCKCDCGKIISVVARDLKNGNTKSCGCLGKQSWIAVKVKKYFVKKYDSIEEYKVTKNPDTGHWLPYDIYIPHGQNTKLNGFYIELNGEQHYKINPWHISQAKRRKSTPEEEFKRQKNRDKLKKKFARKNGTYIEIDLRKIKTTEEVIEYIERIIEKTLS